MTELQAPLCGCGCERRVLWSKPRNGWNTFLRGHKRKRSVKNIALMPEYRAWQGILSRCYNPNNPQYENYGWRGIQVCRGYMKNFKNFFADMGKRPEGETAAGRPLFSLDRRNNNGHYSCGKCDECKKNHWPMNIRWATKKEQANNTRRNVIVGFKVFETLQCIILSKTKPNT